MLYYIWITDTGKFPKINKFQSKGETECQSQMKNKSYSFKLTPILK